MRSERAPAMAFGDGRRDGTCPVAVFTRHRGAGWLCPLDGREIKRALGAMCAAAATLGHPLAGIDLHLVTDAAMAHANAKHLGCTGPTNVLSFPGASGMAGTLLLALDTLDRECLLYGQEGVEHLLRLLAHGVAHLAGLDHGPEMDALCAACEDAASAGLNL